MVLALHVDITGADRPSGDGCSFCCKAILRQPWLLLLDFIGLIHPRMAAVVVVDVSSIHSIRQIQIQVSRSKDHLHHLSIVDKDVSILDSPLLNHYNSCFLRSAERCNISSKLRKALRSRGDASFLPEVTHSTEYLLIILRISAGRTGCSSACGSGTFTAFWSRGTEPLSTACSSPSCR